MSWVWISLRFWLFLLVLQPLLSAAYEVIYAVNCGGGKHTDRFGIRYNSDDNRVGIPSDYGKNLIISRVHPDDMILYQTERYHTTSFKYDVPIVDEGEFLLITKYAEVYFQQPGQKVFDVNLNDLIGISDLDIFSSVGKAAAHDVVLPFSIRDGQLSVEGETSNFDGTLSVEFAKGAADNPKVNAIVIIKGPLEGPEKIPALPPPEVEPLDTEQRDGRDVEWGDTASKSDKFKRTSGPKSQDPYASDDSWFMPITMAVAVFLPVLFCLCRVR